MATVRLNLTLKKHSQNEGVVKVPIRKKTPLTAGLAEIGLTEKEVGFIIRNRRLASRECTVGEEDELDLFPILSGG